MSQLNHGLSRARYGASARADLKPERGAGSAVGAERSAAALRKGKAHRTENLGYAGRRVLVSRKWSGKSLTDHRADRKAWLIAMLDRPATEPQDFTWERVTPADPDHMPPTQRLLHVLKDRSTWNAALADARRRGEDETDAAAFNGGQRDDDQARDPA